MGIDLQKSSNIARSGIDLQILKKVCTSQVCPHHVACVQGVKHLFEDVTLQPKFIKNFRIMSRAASLTSLMYLSLLCTNVLSTVGHQGTIWSHIA